MANNDSIGEALDLAPLEPTKLPDKPQVQDNNDYEYARQNIYSIIETGAHALDELAQVAAQSQHPRAYEVLANLVKTMVEANKDLMNLKKTKAEIDNANPDQVTNNKVQNNLFVGSTAELQKLLSSMKNGPSS